MGFLRDDDGGVVDGAFDGGLEDGVDGAFGVEATGGVGFPVGGFAEFGFGEGVEVAGAGDAEFDADGVADFQAFGGGGFGGEGEVADGTGERGGFAFGGKGDDFDRDLAAFGDDFLGFGEGEAAERGVRHAALAHDLDEEFLIGGADFEVAGSEGGDGGAEGEDVEADVGDDFLGLFGLLREALDGEVVFVDVDETEAAEAHLAGDIEGGGEGDEFALIDFGFADFELEEGFLGAGLTGVGALGVDLALDDFELDLVGLDGLISDGDGLGGDDEVAGFGADKGPGEGHL